MLIYSVVQHFLGNTVSGWSSTMVSIWAIGGLQILSMGVIGEYNGRDLWKQRRDRSLSLKNS